MKAFLLMACVSLSISAAWAKDGRVVQAHVSSTNNEIVFAFQTNRVSEAQFFRVLRTLAQETPSQKIEMHFMPSLASGALFAVIQNCLKESKDFRIVLVPENGAEFNLMNPSLAEILVPLETMANQLSDGIVTKVPNHQP